MEATVELSKFHKKDSKENVILQLSLKHVLRFNILNQKVVWVPYTKTSTISDLKKELKHEDFDLPNPQDLKDLNASIMVVFEQINISDSEVVCKKFNPGDQIDVQFKLNLNREAEYVTHDK